VGAEFVVVGFVESVYAKVVSSGDASGLRTHWSTRELRVQKVNYDYIKDSYYVRNVKFSKERLKPRMLKHTKCQLSELTSVIGTSNRSVNARRIR